MRKLLSFFFIITLAAFTAVPCLFADDRTLNIELFLVIDKSKSMVEEITDVTSYINKVFINDFLIPGDRFVLIQFYGKADLIFDEIITDSSMQRINREISEIPADGRFTDIGNALDELNRTLENSQPTGGRQYLILLTDGKQEAPEESRYYSPDGSFNHEFLENTKIIQRKGWKIIILGIGSDTAASELSDKLLTTYKELDFTGDTVPEMSKDDILGRIIANNLLIDNGILSIELESEGYISTRIIEIEQILYQISDGNHELLSAPVFIEIKPEEKKRISIELDPAKIKNITNDSEKGSLLFNFSGDTPFLPAVWRSNLILSGDTAVPQADNTVLDENKNENNQNNKNKGSGWIIIVIIILVIAGIIAAVIIRNSLLHRDDEDDGKKQKISDNN
ncbi:MAG: VWA domain-containing protein [Spirochaetales bacterium]|nr:VWA domain-containing protein [Spirochaetales bacterium]